MPHGIQSQNLAHFFLTLANINEHKFMTISLALPLVLPILALLNFTSFPFFI